MVIMSWLSTISTSSPALRFRLSRIGLGKLMPTEFPHVTSFALNLAMPYATITHVYTWVGSLV
jgi:hypothetical protein